MVKSGLLSTQTFRRALAASADSFAETKSAPSVYALFVSTSSGRVWRKVPESDARSQTPRHWFTTSFLQEDAGKRCSESNSKALVYDILPSGRCRKAMLGVKLQGTGLRHPSGRCRKAMLRVKLQGTGLRHPSFRKVPESDARSQTPRHWFTTSFLQEGAGKRCSECGSESHSEHRFPAPSSKLGFSQI